MSGPYFRRFLAAALVAVTGMAMIATSFDAEAARRVGGAAALVANPPT